MFTLCEPWITFELFEASISVLPVISPSIFLSSLNNVARKIISILPSAVEELRLCSSKRSLCQTWYDSRSMAIQLEQLGDPSNNWASSLSCSQFEAFATTEQKAHFAGF